MSDSGRNSYQGSPNSRRNSYNSSYVEVMKYQQILRTIDPAEYLSEDSAVVHAYAGPNEEEYVEGRGMTNFSRRSYSQELISSELPSAIPYHASSQEYEAFSLKLKNEREKEEEVDITDNHLLYVRGLEIASMEKEAISNPSKILSQEELISSENLRQEAFAAIKNKQLEWLAIVLGIGQTLTEAKEEYRKQCFSILSFKETLDCITAIIKTQLECLRTFNHSPEKDLKQLKNSISETVNITTRDHAIEKFKNAFNEAFKSIPPTINLEKHIKNIEKILELYRINVEEVGSHEWVKLYEIELKELGQLQEKWPMAQKTAMNRLVQIKNRWEECKKNFIELHKKNQLPASYTQFALTPERIFEANWNVNTPDKDHGNLLSYALAQDSPGAVSLLLRRGADPLQGSDQHLSALRQAVDQPNLISHKVLINWVRKNPIEELWPQSKMLFAYLPLAFKIHLETLKDNMDQFLDSFLQSAQLSKVARFFLLEWDLNKRIQEWEIYLSIVKEGVISGKVDELPNNLQQHAQSSEKKMWRVWQRRLELHRTMDRIVEPAKKFVEDSGNKHDFILAQLSSEEKAIAIIDHFSSMGSLVKEEIKKREEAEKQVQTLKIQNQQNQSQLQQEQLRRLAVEKELRELRKTVEEKKIKNKGLREKREPSLFAARK